MRLKARRDFKGPGITPKAGQWYINKENLTERKSKYVFAYRVTSITKLTKRCVCSAERVVQMNRCIQKLESVDFIMLPAKVFKPVDETTIAAYLL